jgi:hypothetical protein
MLICSQLEKKGFTVVTYSRKDFDFPFIDENGKKYFSSLTKVPGYLRVLRKAADIASANAQGKILEAERQIDIELLLPHVLTLMETPLLLVGYGAGGSALAYLSGDDSFVSRYDKVLGVIAIESRLWSSYQKEPRIVPGARLNRGMVMRKLSEIDNFLHSFFPENVRRNGTLPVSDTPILYLVSSRVIDPFKGRKPYRAVFDALRLSSGPIAVAAVKGFGPLDYQDFPLTHPIYSFLMPGLKDTENSLNPINDTANIIGNFASLLLEQTKQSEKNIPPVTPISGSLYIESKGLPWLRL